MNSLVSKDEALKSSIVHVGYLILKKLQRAVDGRLSLTDVAKHLRSHGITRSRPMMFALIFLHSIGAVDFSAPYIHRVTS